MIENLHKELGISKERMHEIVDKVQEINNSTDNRITEYKKLIEEFKGNLNELAMAFECLGSIRILSVMMKKK